MRQNEGRSRQILLRALDIIQSEAISMSIHAVTPVIDSAPLAAVAGCRVLLKLENAQPSGSFKIRGIGRLCQELVSKGHLHLVSSSGGNAGMAVAHAGRLLGVKVTVVIPASAPAFMRRKIALEGAQVIVHGAAWDEAHKEAQMIAAELNTEVVHPFDNPTIWDGHATMIHELVGQLKAPPTVRKLELTWLEHLVTVAGGGGLLVGLLKGLKEVGWKDVKVHVSETIGCHSLYEALKAGHLVTLPGITSIATTLGARTVAQEAFERGRDWPVLPYLVTDSDALSAVKLYQADHQQLVELSCGAGLALLYDPQRRQEAFGSLKPTDKILVVVCGGNAMSVELLEHFTKVLAEKAAPSK